MRAMKNMQHNIYLMAESPKFLRNIGNRGQGTPWLLLGVLMSVLILVKIDQEMRP